MSSNSKSRSSRSKKKRSKSSPRPGDLKPTEDSPKDGRTDLLAMILGMVTTIVMVFGVFGFGSEQVVNEKYEREQDRRQQELIDAKKASTLDELFIELADLGVAKTSNLPDMIRVSNSAVNISKEILERGPTSEAMRELAVTEGMLAQVKLYGLDLVNGLDLVDVGSQLEAAYTPYLEDKNKKIYSTSRVARLTHQSFEALKAGTGEVGELVQLFEDTMNRFPDDEHVATMIEAHLFVLVEREPQYAQTLFWKLREKNPSGAVSETMERKMLNVADRLLLNAEGFKQKFADRWANGKKGRTELTETVVRLLSNKNVGLYLVQRALAVGQWFERNDFTPQANEVYGALITSANNGNVAEVYRPDTIKYAEDGMTRLALKGTIIEYYGNDSAGKPLDDAKLKKKIGIVVFWSKSSQASIQYLAEMNASARVLSNKPIVILAVCTDEKLPIDINVSMRKHPMIRIVDPIFESGKNSLLEKCPPGLLPHVMLVDFGGKVHDINGATPGEIKNEAMALLMNRAR